MRMEDYIGQEGQIRGVEEHRLIGGRGDGMRLFEVRNGLGLAFTVSADRCADISRLSFKGDNYGYFAPCGYVAPAYYDDQGEGFLKSFTAGFLTTCGLTAVGAPCTDMGEALPLHGSIGNTPAERMSWEMEEGQIRLRAVIRDGRLFARKLALTRQIVCSTERNAFSIEDTVENQGDQSSPLMLLYHMNLGYPLLSEQLQLHIPAQRVLARNAHAAEDLARWDQMLPPTAGFEEQCYYHQFDGEQGLAAAYNPALGKGLAIRFPTECLDHFTQWKMMGVRDYVLGLEPGNCHPDGRDKMRAQGKLKTLAPGQRRRFTVQVEMIEGESQWEQIHR
ncbi:MAG: aldose 1-epimerase family protein [Christensenellales bacterium]|jgi:hypothetical protein